MSFEWDEEPRAHPPDEPDESATQAPSTEELDAQAEGAAEAVEESTGGWPGITVEDLPEGYVYYGTHHADVVLRDAYPEHWRDLIEALEAFRIDIGEIRAAGGGETTIVQKLDRAFHDRGWRKVSMTIGTQISLKVKGGATQLHEREVRTHEIDMFKIGPNGFPGIGQETEWHNKTEFFDRDLNNFDQLHAEGALSVGLLITRSLRLLHFLSHHPDLDEGVRGKYGVSTTHWGHLMTRMDAGRGGRCPLLLIGIEPERIDALNLEAELLPGRPWEPRGGRR